MKTVIELAPIDIQTILIKHLAEEGKIQELGSFHISKKVTTTFMWKDDHSCVINQTIQTHENDPYRPDFGGD